MRGSRVESIPATQLRTDPHYCQTERARWLRHSSLNHPHTCEVIGFIVVRTSHATFATMHSITTYCYYYNSTLLYSTTISTTTTATTYTKTDTNTNDDTYTYTHTYTYTDTNIKPNIHTNINANIHTNIDTNTTLTSITTITRRDRKSSLSFKLRLEHIIF